MNARAWGLCALSALAACSNSDDRTERRAELVTVGPANVRVVPAAGQLPFCLLFSVSQRNVVRQLTMSPTRKAIPCRAGEPLGGVTYKIPPAEGAVRLYLLFSDQEVAADPIARQVQEVAMAGRIVTAMDLRAPGQLRIETFEFSPSGAGEAADIVVVDTAPGSTP